MSRIPTQRSTALSLHPTALTRIQTGRSQHSATVGRLAGTQSREDRRPLPEMGAGKPYPPLLPAQEEYVVEFDGEDDERHAQNWPMKKK
jgi:MFS transporter, DHA1 family, multidrug resistance protein